MSMLHNFPCSRFTGALPYFVFYLVHSLGSLPPQQRCSRWILQYQPIAPNKHFCKAVHLQYFTDLLCTRYRLNVKKNCEKKFQIKSVKSTDQKIKSHSWSLLAILLVYCFVKSIVIRSGLSYPISNTESGSLHFILCWCLLSKYYIVLMPLIQIFHCVNASYPNIFLLTIGK